MSPWPRWRNARGGTSPFRDGNDRGGAYVLRYRIDEDAVVVARVWHSREARE